MHSTPRQQNNQQLSNTATRAPPPTNRNTHPHSADDADDNIDNVDESDIEVELEITDELSETQIPTACQTLEDGDEYFDAEVAERDEDNENFSGNELENEFLKSVVRPSQDDSSLSEIFIDRLKTILNNYSEDK